MVRISVIVPNYNHAKYLEQRIDTILDQTYQDWEIIILDDNSEDNSREIIDVYIKRYPSIKCFYNESNSGNPFKQWDLGVSKATGEYIWIAESDDFADPLFLERSAQLLSENPSLGLVYCNSIVTDEETNSEYLISDSKKNLQNNKWSEDYLNGGRDEINECLFRQNTINNVSGVLFRKSSYIEAGYAAHSMKYCGDWFLYIRILLRSDIGYISTPLNTLRLHARSSNKDYYTDSTYLSEVLMIYSFINSEIRLNLKKKLGMLRVLTGIIRRMLSRGRIPQFSMISKILFAKNKRWQSDQL
jgi:glycosyltransferase involved in cell wall biosynthesis